jgi:hypothetical protein
MYTITGNDTAGVVVIVGDGPITDLADVIDALEHDEIAGGRRGALPERIHHVCQARAPQTRDEDHRSRGQGHSDQADPRGRKHPNQGRRPGRSGQAPGADDRRPGYFGRDPLPRRDPGVVRPLQGRRRCLAPREGIHRQAGDRGPGRVDPQAGGGQAGRHRRSLRRTIQTAPVRTTRTGPPRVRQAGFRRAPGRLGAGVVAQEEL